MAPQLYKNPIFDPLTRLPHKNVMKPLFSYVSLKPIIRQRTPQHNNGIVHDRKFMRLNLKVCIVLLDHEVAISVGGSEDLILFSLTSILSTLE